MRDWCWKTTSSIEDWSIELCRHRIEVLDIRVSSARLLVCLLIGSTVFCTYTKSLCMLIQFCNWNVVHKGRIFGIFYHWLWLSIRIKRSVSVRPFADFLVKDVVAQPWLRKLIVKCSYWARLEQLLVNFYNWKLIFICSICLWFFYLQSFKLEFSCYLYYSLALPFSHFIGLNLAL